MYLQLNQHITIPVQKAITPIHASPRYCCHEVPAPSTTGRMVFTDQFCIPRLGHSSSLAVGGKVCNKLFQQKTKLEINTHLFCNPMRTITCPLPHYPTHAGPLRQKILLLLLFYLTHQDQSIHNYFLDTQIHMQFRNV